MRHTLYGIPIDDLGSEELTRQLEAWLHSDSLHIICTPNPEFLLHARHDRAFAELLRRCDLALPDGVGLHFAVAALTEQRLTHRHTGIDSLLLLARIGEEHGKTMLLVGGHPGSVEKAAAALRAQFPRLVVVGIDPGYLRGGAGEVEVPEQLLERMRAVQPAILAVALGQGKQEQFIFQSLTSLPSVRLAIGVGGAFDMLSGRLPRAPQIMRMIGLEWLWRLCLEPRRVRRIINAVLVFPLVVVYATLKQRRFLRACQRVFPEVLRQLFRH